MGVESTLVRETSMLKGLKVPREHNEINNQIIQFSWRRESMCSKISCGHGKNCRMTILLDKNVICSYWYMLGTQ